MKLSKRLAALEMDGRTVTITNPGDYMVRLLGVVLLSPVDEDV